MNAISLHERVGDLPPAGLPDGSGTHPPLLLLWAIGRAVQGHPRLQRWSQTHHQVGELLARFGEVAEQRQAALTTLWALKKAQLWEIDAAETLPLAGRRRQPTLDTIDDVDPLAGLTLDDFELMSTDRVAASEVAASLIIRFFNPMPVGLLEALGLDDLMMGQVADWLRPRVGDRFERRSDVHGVYGGQSVAGIRPFRDGVLNAFSKDNGPYRDGRLPGTDWIAYAGEGPSGDQTLDQFGNKALAACQEAQRPLRFWHKPERGPFTFESWVVVAQRRFRWGHGTDGKSRREFLWVLAPVPSPLKEHWPHEIIELLDAEAGLFHDDTEEDIPAELIDSRLSPAEKYRHLSAAAANAIVKRNGQRSRPSTIERYLRSASARDAVILRSRGLCENPDCEGHPTELTDSGEPILEVDHLNDLGRGGKDHPENMIALCPNCHALKTRGRKRHELTQRLRVVAKALHSAFSAGAS